MVGLVRRSATVIVATLLLFGAGCDMSTTTDNPEDYTVAEKLAIVHGGDTSSAGEFQQVIDCVMASGIEGAETEEQVGDVLVASWEESGKRESLLEWAQALC